MPRKKEKAVAKTEKPKPYSAEVLRTKAMSIEDCVEGTRYTEEKDDKVLRHYYSTRNMRASFAAVYPESSSYTMTTRRARVFFDREEIKQKMDMIRESNMLSLGIDLEFVLLNLKAIADDAFKNGDRSNARQSWMDIAKLKGFVVDKQKHDHRIHMDVEKASDEELAKFIRENN